MIVADELGLSWSVRSDPFGHGIASLAGLAVRDNPRRAHLVVSPVLAKHVPVRPSVAFARAAELASLVGPLARPVVVGFCETATGLGHAVAEELTGSAYIHTTRRPDVTGHAFSEEHSHAPSHVLAATDALADPTRPLVLVDDELTTGTTALNTLAALREQHTRQHQQHEQDREYVIACLLDLRGPEARAAFDRRAAELGIAVRTVALIDGTLDLPADVLERGRPIQDRLRGQVDPELPPRADVRVHEPIWPGDVPTSGRHGVTDHAAFRSAVDDLADQLAGSLTHDREKTGKPVLVVGTEELMHLPNRLALALERGLDVVVQSTTRSPVLPWDVDGYAVRHRLCFPSTEDPGRTAFLYNVVDAYSDVVVVTEDPSEQALPLAEALRPFADGTVHVVAL